MAAPPEVTIENLGGKFVMNKSLSDPSDPILALQGISWFQRKAIGLATVTMHINVFAAPASASSIPGTKQIKIIQVLTGGIKGTTELRTLDYEERAHTDHVFGNMVGRSHYISSLDVIDKEILTQKAEGGVDDLDVKFLKGEVLIDGTTASHLEPASGEKAYIHSFVKNEEAQWTAEQVWGFEEVGGKRYYARRVVVRRLDDEKVVRARFLYDYGGKAELTD